MTLVRFSLHLAALIAGSMFTQAAYAQRLPPHEYADRVKASRTVQPLNNDLLGDRSAPFDGSTTFEVIDIDLKGNNSLPVQFGRRYKVKIASFGLSPSGFDSGEDNLPGMGSWEYSVPHIVATIDANSHWIYGPGNVQTPRCSSPFYPSPQAPFNHNDGYSGMALVMPGRNPETIFYRSENTPKPTDGAAYKWTTNNFSAIKCIAMTNYPGEGFLLVDTQGKLRARDSPP